MPATTAVVALSKALVPGAVMMVRAVMAAGSSLAPSSRTPDGKPANNESLIAFALPK